MFGSFCEKVRFLGADSQPDHGEKAGIQILTNTLKSGKTVRNYAANYFCWYSELVA